jgi:hypothetical protein
MSYPSFKTGTDGISFVNAQKLHMWYHFKASSFSYKLMLLETYGTELVMTSRAHQSHPKRLKENN